MLFALLCLALAALVVWIATSCFGEKKGARSAPPPTSIESFIRTAPAAPLNAVAEKPPSAPGLNAEQLSEPRVRVLVLFGTEYGCSKEKAEALAKTLQDHQTMLFRPVLVNMAHHPHGLASLAHEQVILVLCSTHGDGVPPAPARPFIEWLSSTSSSSTSASQDPPISVRGHFSVLAFGDKSYTHYCKCGKDLDQRLARLGGRRCAQLVEVDRENTAAIARWTESVIAALKSLYPSLDKSLPSPEELTLSAESVAGALGMQTTSSQLPGTCRENPVHVPVLSTRLLTAPLEAAEDKETVHIELDVSSLSFPHTPGDALGVLPQNNVHEVQRLLAAANLAGSESVQSPAWAPSGTPTNLSLQEALLSHYDLRQPRQSLLVFLQSRLLLHVNGQPLTHELTEAYLNSRHVADVLNDAGAALATPNFFSSASQLLSHLRPLLPRLYSISNSDALQPGKLSITVAAVWYSTLGLHREGVASTFLCSRISAGQHLSVFVQRNPDFRLPANPSSPIIMIGPGTGLAPFRAFVQEREAISQRAPFPVLGRQLLFFGCRHPQKDFLYESELRGWHESGVITLYTAFSRLGAPKVYVQDLLRQQADEVLGLIQHGAHVYVCGDAKSMAPQVEECLVYILSRGTEGDVGSARAWLTDMGKEGRYQRDVWFS